MTNEVLNKAVAKMVAAYVSFNDLPKSELPGLIETVHDCCKRLGQNSTMPPVPKADISKSVRPNHIICLEDGLKLKTLTRHLKTAHALTPYEYRKKWGLPIDYPMTAVKSAKLRSDAAIKIGFGKRRPKYKEK